MRTEGAGVGVPVLLQDVQSPRVVREGDARGELGGHVPERRRGPGEGDADQDPEPEEPRAGSPRRAGGRDGGQVLRAG